MRRTSLEIDEERLARAQQALGTSGIKDTIDRALDEVFRAELRRRLAERVRSGEGIDRGEDLLAASRRWQR
jgi:Arc/MetJ family transcription regulator